MRFRVLFLLPAAIVGCGTTSPLHFSSALVGRVVDRAFEDDHRRTHMSTSFFPTSGGALIPVPIPQTRGRPANFTYTIKPEQTDRPLAIAASETEFKIGDCIEVLSEPQDKDDGYWSLGRATVRPSTKCR